MRDLFVAQTSLFNEIIHTNIFILPLGEAEADNAARAFVDTVVDTVQLVFQLPSMTAAKVDFGYKVDVWSVQPQQLNVCVLCLRIKTQYVR
jgi:hypothetical protein